VRTIVVRVFLVAVSVSVIFVWYARRGQNIVVAQEHTAVTVTRLYTGADNLSHVEQVNVKFSPVAGAPETVGQSESVKVAKSYVVLLPAGFYEGWHNADTRRYVIPISGKAELEVGGGQKISAEPGRLYLAEDLTGKSHTFRVVGTHDWVALFVDFAP
jgi:hypothetical protein